MAPTARATTTLVRRLITRPPLTAHAVSTLALLPAFSDAVRGRCAAGAARAGSGVSVPAMKQRGVEVGRLGPKPSDGLRKAHEAFVSPWVVGEKWDRCLCAQTLV